MAEGASGRPFVLPTEAAAEFEVDQLPSSAPLRVMTQRPRFDSCLRHLCVGGSSSGNSDHVWRFLTNHTHVLQCINTDPTARISDIAANVGITERAAAAIVADLEEAGYLTRIRVGRRNRYEIHPELPLRHPMHRHRTVGDLIRFLETPAGREGKSS